MIENWVIKGCVNGQERAQRELYLVLGPTVKSICMRYIKDTNLSKDVFHDCFIKIMGSVKKINGNGSFEGWVKRVAVNYCLDYLRKVQKIQFVNSPVELKDEEAVENEIDVKNINSSAVEKAGFTKEELLSMLEELPEIYKVAFSLFQVENYSHKEIANLLNIDEKTSRSRVARARKKLKEILVERTKERLQL